MNKSNMTRTNTKSVNATQKDAQREAQQSNYQESTQDLGVNTIPIVNQLNVFVDGLNSFKMQLDTLLKKIGIEGGLSDLPCESVKVIGTLLCTDSNNKELFTQLKDILKDYLKKGKEYNSFQQQVMSPMQQIPFTSQPSFTYNGPVRPLNQQPTYSSNAPTSKPSFSTNASMRQPSFSSSGPLRPSGLSSNAPASQPSFSSSGPLRPYGLSSNVPMRQPSFSSNGPLRPSGLSSNAPMRQPSFSSNAPMRQSSFSSSGPLRPSGFSSNVPIRNQSLHSFRR